MTVLKAIEIPLRCLYSSDDSPDIKQSTLKPLVKLVVTNEHFNCNNRWYCQVDGIAVGATFAVILAKVSIKLMKEKPKNQSCFRDPRLEKDPSEICLVCSRKLVCNCTRVEFERFAKMVLCKVPEEAMTNTKYWRILYGAIVTAINYQKKQISSK